MWQYKSFWVHYAHSYIVKKLRVYSTNYQTHPFLCSKKRKGLIHCAMCTMYKHKLVQSSLLDIVIARVPQCCMILYLFMAEHCTEGDGYRHIKTVKISNLKSNTN